MLRPLALLALAIGVAPALLAQEKPAPAVQQAVSGKWLLDQAHSDTIPDDPLAHATGRGAISGGNSSHAGASGGGGGGGGKGKGAPPPAAAPAPSSDTPAPAPAAGAFGRGRDPHMQMVTADANPGAGMVIAANDSTVALATAAMLRADPKAQSNWKTNGRPYQDAQMDGTIVQTQAGWKDATLTLTYGIAGIGSLKREFKPGKDGKTLELKETIEAGGRKAEYKLTFTRE